MNYSTAIAFINTSIAIIRSIHLLVRVCYKRSCIHGAPDSCKKHTAFCADSDTQTFISICLVTHLSTTTCKWGRIKSRTQTRTHINTTTIIVPACNESQTLSWRGHAPTHLVVLGTVAEHQSDVVDELFGALVVLWVLPLQLSLHQVQVHGVLYDLIIVGHLV